jgi:multiple sugar transport system permease protein
MIDIKRKFKDTFIYVILIIAILVAIAPYIWILTISLKTRKDYFSIPPVWDFQPIIDHYKNALIERGYYKNLINSAIVSISSTILALLAGTMAAYSFSRFRFTGDKHLFFFTLTTRMAPPVALSLPYYIIVTKIGLYDTHIALILAHTAFNLAFVIWIMKGFFDGIPKAIDEAASIDGLSPWTTYWKIVLPNALPGVGVTAVFCIIFSWNEFLLAMTLTNKNAGTLPVAILGLVTTQGTNWGQIAAVGVATTIPLILMAWLIQKYLLRGFTLGAVK